jgi:hypothetical protein
MSITGVVLSPKIGARMTNAFPEPGAAVAESVAFPSLLFR